MVEHTMFMYIIDLMILIGKFVFIGNLPKKHEQN